MNKIPNTIFTNDLLWTEDLDLQEAGQHTELNHKELGLYEGQILSVGKEVFYVHKLKKNKVILKSVRAG